MSNNSAKYHKIKTYGDNALIKVVNEYLFSTADFAESFIFAQNGKSTKYK